MTIKHTIELKHISKEFVQGHKSVVLFTDASYTFVQGNSYALTGVSGTGKSTLLNIITGIEIPTSGSVLYDDFDRARVSAEHAREYLQRYIGIVFQYAYLIPELSVLENVGLKGRIAGLSHKESMQYAGELLDQVGLSSKLYSKPQALSGGEQQRVAIARALMMKPPFIIADEPTAHLDEHNKKSVCDLLLSCKDIFGSAVIVSSHDRYIVERMEHVLTIDTGKLCHE